MAINCFIAQVNRESSFSEGKMDYNLEAMQPTEVNSKDTRKCRELLRGKI